MPSKPMRKSSPSSPQSKHTKYGSSTSTTSPPTLTTGPATEQQLTDHQDQSPDDSASAAAAEADKPRLSDSQKKSNHIASEQKRRQAIREGFDRLTELVPGLEGQGRSEGLVLKRTVEYMREALEERRRLVAEVEGKGGDVGDLKIER